MFWIFPVAKSILFEKGVTAVVHSNVQGNISLGQQGSRCRYVRQIMSTTLGNYPTIMAKCPLEHMAQPYSRKVS